MLYEQRRMLYEQRGMLYEPCWMFYESRPMFYDIPGRREVLPQTAYRLRPLLHKAFRLFVSSVPIAQRSKRSGHL